MARTAGTDPGLLAGDAMLGAVAFSAQQLLLAPDLDAAIDAVLVHLGMAARVSRAYLIEVRPGGNGEFLATQRAEWCDAGVTSQFDNPILRGVDLGPSGFERWVELMRRGETVSGIVAELPASERPELEAQDIVSIAGVPVFVDGTWWGFIGFDDCFRERVWTDQELDPLRAVAGIVGAAVQRERAEHRLRDAEERYRAMVELIPAVTYTDFVGPDGLTVMGFVSPQMRQVLGVEPQRFLEEPQFWFELMHPDDLARLRAINAFDNTDVAPFDHEYRMRHADGHWVWVHDTSTAVFDQRGNLAYFLGFLHDISARKDAEERLREAEVRFRTMVEQNPAVFYTMEIDPEDPTRSLTTYVGPGDEGLTGYPLGEVDPLLWQRIVHPDDRERVFAADAESNREGTDFSQEYRIVRKDGKVVWVQDEARLIRQDGKPPYWQGFQLDVTARKEAEQRLHDAHEYLRLVLDSSLDAIVTMDADGVITDWNPQAEATFGWTREHVVGRLLAETIVPHEHRAAHVDGLRRWRETGEGSVLNARFEITALHRDGRLIPVELAIVPISVGEATVFSGFIRDISERTRAREELERALEVEREAAARLRSLDEMKHTFLQAVSHDLRTPLASILGLAITLERGDVRLSEEDTRHLAGRIEHNARRLERLVTNLLDLDRLARGVLTPTFESVDVGELVRRTVAEADPTVRDQVDVSTASTEVLVDPPKIERIVENLLVNAVKHTPRGTPIHVSVLASDEGATILVEDEGPGVPEDLRERIFEEFLRGEDRHEASPGVGVGLSLVRRFAEMHHGRAWVEERAGGGASFRVFLPREHPEASG
jgi:PAS domain S-box-containing protein